MGTKNSKGRNNHEEDISAKQQEAEKDSRLPAENEVGRGKKDPEPAQTETAPETRALTPTRGLTQAERLRKPAEFRRVYAGRKKLANPFFTLYYILNRLSYDRLGITVSKRISKHAVERNRLKRIFREAFRLNKRQSIEGLDLVVHVQQKALKASSALLADTYCKMIARLES